MSTSDLIDKRTLELNSLTYLDKLILNIKSIHQILKIICQLSSNSAGNCPAWVELKEKETTTIHYANNINLEYLTSVYLNNILNKLVDSFEKTKVIFSVKEELSEITVSTGEVIPFNSMVVFPIKINSELNGRMVLAYSKEYYFDEDILKLLETYIENLRVSLENLKSIEITFEKEKLRQELQIAKTIQAKLLPEKIIIVPGIDISAIVLPSEEVGGDFYDILQFDENKYCVIIADVSGKGMSAAFYMALFKGIVLSTSQNVHSLKDFIIKINNSLFHKIEKQIHITVSAIMFDFRDSTVSIIRAGHLPIIYARQRIQNITTPRYCFAFS